MEKSPLLHSLEQLLLRNNRDGDALERLLQLDLPVLLQWEWESEVIQAGIERLHAWEMRFARQYPLVYQRLRQSTARRSQATALLQQIRVDVHGTPSDNMWRALLVLLRESERHDWGVWKADAQMVASNVQDEFGVDAIHFVSRDGSIRVARFQRNQLLSHSISLESPSVMQAWTVPFQEAVVLQLQNNQVVWIPTAKNGLIRSSLESPLCSQVNEDPLLLMASTEDRAAAILVRQRDVLLFDHATQEEPPGKHWRQLLTHELYEPRRIPVTAMCFVLDSLLLYASADGVLRAHPRTNPESTYHVKWLDSHVSHLVGLYNVVAIVYHYNQLEVRHVERQPEDPFVRLDTVLFSAKGVDPDERPLLYGPYCLFKRQVGGEWMRVRYDGSTTRALPLPVKLPFKAGWPIVRIRSANWRYWIVTLQDPATKKLGDYIFFATGGRSSNMATPFLVASCLECGKRLS